MIFIIILNQYLTPDEVVRIYNCRFLVREVKYFIYFPQGKPYPHISGTLLDLVFSACSLSNRIRTCLMRSCSDPVRVRDTAHLFNGIYLGLLEQMTGFPPVKRYLLELFFALFGLIVRRLYSSSTSAFGWHRTVIPFLLIMGKAIPTDQCSNICTWC
jgi:hypothetical protein